MNNVHFGRIPAAVPCNNYQYGTRTAALKFLPSQARCATRGLGLATAVVERGLWPCGGSTAARFSAVSAARAKDVVRVLTATERHRSFNRGSHSTRHVARSSSGGIRVVEQPAAERRQIELNCIQMGTQLCRGTADRLS